MNLEINVTEIAPVAIVVPEVKTRGRKPKTKQYFTKETENAILLYNLLEDEIERNKLYDAEIKYPFDKLVENIIHTFKFYHFDIPYEDVKHEVIAFLNEKIHKYTDPSKGKAFSYFSIIAKNYLIIHNNGNYNKFKNSTQTESIDEDRNIKDDLSPSMLVEAALNEFSYSQLVIIASFYLQGKLDGFADKLEKKLESLKDGIRKIALDADDLPPNVREFLTNMESGNTMDDAIDANSLPPEIKEFLDGLIKGKFGIDPNGDGDED